MSIVRGIPEPHPDVDSLYATVAALKESTESDAQQIRNRSTKQIEAKETEEVIKAREAKKVIDAATAATAAQDESLAKTEEKMSALETRLLVVEQKISLVPGGLDDHETRIVALEGAP